MKVRKLVQLSFFVVIAVALSCVEAALPALSPIQGIKLGLANIITLVLFLYYPAKEVFLVLIARILLASLIGGQMMNFIYSISGGLCSFAVMYGCSRLLHGKFICITSMFGAVFHIGGQLLAASFLLRSWGILVYVPLLLISALLTGFFTGLCAHFFHKKMGGFIQSGIVDKND